jgi:hypothetical protein
MVLVVVVVVVVTARMIESEGSPLHVYIMEGFCRSASPGPDS